VEVAKIVGRCKHNQNLQAKEKPREYS